jgi:methyl-accepting chemotaxis protein
MPDNLNLRRPQDSRRINVNQNYELNPWAKYFGVSEDELRRTVKTVGTSVDAVTNWFQDKEPVQRVSLNLEQLNHQRQINAEKITSLANTVTKLFS